MNHRVVRYSAAGAVVLAAVIGIVYFVFLNGTHADEGTAGDSRSAGDTAAGKNRARSPDPLFAEPVQVWNAGRQEKVDDPFHARAAQVAQTAYSEAEPRRLTPDPDANPLRIPDGSAYDNRSQAPAQLTGASENPPATSSNASGQPRDPFGLTGSGNGALAADNKPTSLGATDGTGNLPNKNGETKRPASLYGDAAQSADSGPLQPARPAPLQKMPNDRTSGAPVAPPPSRQYDLTKQGALPRSGESGSSPSFEPRSTLQRAPAEISDEQDVGDAKQHLGAASPLGAANLTADPLNSFSAEPRSSGSPAARTGLSGSRAIQSDNSNAFATAAAPVGSAEPGSRQVEGKQVPQITIEKTAPQEIQVGKSAKFELHIRNTGTVVAQDVAVRDMIPKGTQFVTAHPPTTPGLQGELDWMLGTLKPGDESTIEVELMPTTEGDVGSVAIVSFHAEAGARSRVTRPDLTVQVTAPKQVMIGHEVTLSIKVGNPGTGPATGVVLVERVPAGLKHSAGGELEFDIGTLKPGETRELDLALTAAQAGRIVNQLVARGEGNLQVPAQCELEVIAPALEITMEGPSRRYLERQATYSVSVSNPGTAPAKDIELVTRLPRGLKFVKANNSGRYDPNTHTVVWSLEELPPAETGTVMLTAIPIEPGEQRLRAEGRAKQNLSDEKEQVTLVEGLEALLFEVVDVSDPIEVKGQTEYEIRVTNQGSKAADNVRVVALLPPELKFVSAEGPTRHVAEGQRVVFEPLGRLSPKADTSYRIAVEGIQPGDVRMKVQLMTDDMRQPVTKEESTRVYSDE